MKPASIELELGTGLALGGLGGLMLNLFQITRSRFTTWITGGAGAILLSFTVLTSPSLWANPTGQAVAVSQTADVAYRPSAPRALTQEVLDSYLELIRTGSQELTSPADVDALSSYQMFGAIEPRVRSLISTIIAVERELLGRGWRKCANVPSPSAKNGFRFAYVDQRCFVSAVETRSTWLDSFVYAPLEAQSVIYAYYKKTLRDLSGSAPQAAKTRPTH